MNKFTVVFILIYVVATLSACQSNNNTGAEELNQAVPVIFDTDIGPDYDDVGAIAILHALADRGEANILATMASNKYEGVASVLDLFNTYFGRPEIPIGVATGNAVNEKDWQNWSDTIRLKYPHRIQSNAEVDDATSLYRKILASQPDHSVTIVTVGFLTNMADLLKSAPDEHSELNGRDLVARKVKVLVSMAGEFPQGKEFNIYKEIRSGRETFDSWPTDVIFSGFEIGKKVKTGIPLIKNQKIRKNPVKDVYKISIPQSDEDKEGRMSWDQTAVLVAVRGADPYYELVPGRIVTAEDGSNTWDSNGKGHFYIKEKRPFEEVTALIDELMQHQPK